MLKLLLLTLLALPTISIAQNIVVVDRNSRTESIFNEDDPYSFISILQGNDGILDYFDIMGIPDSIYESLSKEQQSGILKYRGPESTTPLIDGDPNSDTFGEELIEELEDGSLAFVYPGPEMVYLDLHDISRLLFHYEEGEGEIEPRIVRVELWKYYDDNLTRVADLDARNLMCLDGFKIIKSLNEEWNRKIVGPSKEPYLWRVARDSSMSKMKFVKSFGQKDLYYEYYSNYMQRFYLTEYLIAGLYGGRGPSNVFDIDASDLQEYGSDYDYWERKLPFRIDLIDNIEIDTIDERPRFQWFDSVYYTYHVDNIPIIDNDPASARYGMDRIKITEDGRVLKYYNPDHIVYFWVDYEPIVFISEGIYYDHKTGTSTSVPEDLYFCYKHDNGKPYLVSHMNIESQFASFFVDYPKVDFSELEWKQMLSNEIRNKKNRFDLSSAKSRKKLKKRTKKLR